MRLYTLSCLIIFIIFFNWSLVDANNVLKPTLIRRDDEQQQSTTTATATATAITALTTATATLTSITTTINKKDDDARKDTATRVTTEIVIYTTIIETTTPLPVIRNMSDTGSAAQQQLPQPTPSTTTAIATSATGVNDPNTTNTNVAANLKKDQAALNKMIMILSLVGGLGVIAVVATVVIFTRMRARNKRQRCIDESSAFDIIHDENALGTLLQRPSGGDTTSIHSTLASTTSSNTHIEPSAPPALLLIGDNHSMMNKQERITNRRNVLSMSSQTTAPSPSAPTAKELDAMVDDVTNASSGSTSNACPHATSLPSELPPPAYTPSAPPHYALPVEPIIIESSSSSSSSSSSQALVPPSRRHSLGA